jgi:hypothetical protein
MRAGDLATVRPSSSSRATTPRSRARPPDSKVMKRRESASKSTVPGTRCARHRGLSPSFTAAGRRVFTSQLWSTVKHSSASGS